MRKKNQGNEKISLEESKRERGRRSKELRGSESSFLGEIESKKIIKKGDIWSWFVISSPTPIGCFRGVVVITCASHAQGRRFEPGRKHEAELFFLAFSFHLFYTLFSSLEYIKKSKIFSS